MNLTTTKQGDITVVLVDETRLMYPLLSEFSDTVTGLITGGQRKLLVDISPVIYVASATIGCLMDFFRQAVAGGWTLKLAGIQKRVETMLTMTGAHNFIELFADQAAAVKSFEA